MFKLVFALSLVGSSALAQAPDPNADFSPPPLVPAAPPPPPAPEPGSQLVQPGTPPPPSTLPPPGYVPGQPQSPYPYSPYGTPQPGLTEKPPIEWGLMVGESLFGMLTSSAVALVPYFLFLRGMVERGDTILGDAAATTVVFVMVFSTLPLAVTQTQIAVANGSRHYVSDSWPAALAGLGAEAAVLGIFFALPRRVGYPNVTEMSGKNDIFLLVGSVVFVPLVQMAVINLTKSLRVGRSAGISRDEKGKVALGLPTVAPLLGQTRQGLAVGMQAQLFNLRW